MRWSRHCCTRRRCATTHWERSGRQIDGTIERRYRAMNCTNATAIIIHQCPAARRARRPEERERSSIWSTTSGLFAGVRTDAASRIGPRGTAGPRCLPGGPPSCTSWHPADTRRSTIPLVVGLSEANRHATIDRHEGGSPIAARPGDWQRLAPLPRPGGHCFGRRWPGSADIGLPARTSAVRRSAGVPAAPAVLSLFSTTVVRRVCYRPTLELLSHTGRTHPRTEPHLQVGSRGRSAAPLDEFEIERDRATIAEAGPAPTRLSRWDSMRPTSMNWIELTPAHRHERFRPHRERSDHEPERSRGWSPTRTVSTSPAGPAYTHPGQSCAPSNADVCSRIPRD